MRSRAIIEDVTEMNNCSINNVLNCVIFLTDIKTDIKTDMKTDILCHI